MTDFSERDYAFMQAALAVAREGGEQGEVPVGAVIRHPEFIPLARTACLPGGVSPDAGALFPR